MIPALSTCWNSGRHREGEAMLQEIRDLGFDRVELGHHVSMRLWPGILNAVEGKLIAVDSVHNFCPIPPGVVHPSPNCFQFSEERTDLRRRAVRHTLETFDYAVQVGARVVVLHLGWAGPKGITPRLEELWMNGEIYDRTATAAKVAAVRKRRAMFDVVYGRVRDCLEELVPAALARGLRLGFEIREDYAEFPDEIEMEQLLLDFPAEVAGYWHDFGHSARKEFLGWHDHAATLAARHDRLIGCHIHDCSPPNHDHQPLGLGRIDFEALVPLIPGAAIQTLELSPRVAPDDVIKSRETWGYLVTNFSASQVNSPAS